MNVLALILNIFIPGVGSFVIGKVGQGIGQIVLWGAGLILWLTVIGAIFGFPLMLGAWIWGIVTAVGTKEPQSMTVNVVQQVGDGNVSPPARPVDVTPSQSVDVKPNQTLDAQVQPKQIRDE